MLRHASSRNHRSKGFKVRHALQICLLIAICIWLLYQVKRSHEKKKAFEERNPKNLNKVVENPEDFFKLGREGLPLIGEAVFENETSNKEDEKENDEAEEEEPATKQQEEIEDDEGRGDGDDDLDERDQEKVDEEAENGEESTEEEDKDSHDEVDLFDNQDAIEENYKRDDASSAVVHHTVVAKPENSNGVERSMEDESNDNGSKQPDDSEIDEDSNGNGSNHDVDPSANGSKSDADANTDSFKGEARTETLEKKTVESENVTNGTDDGSRGDTVVKNNEGLSTDNLPSNAMAENKNIEAVDKEPGIEFSKPDNGSVANSTIVEDNFQMEQKATVNADDIAMSNDTNNSDMAQYQKNTGDGTTQGEDEHNSSRNMETEGFSTVSSSTNENGDAAHEESENLSHAVITEEENFDHIGLSTLPDIQSELISRDDEAAE